MTVKMRNCRGGVIAIDVKGVPIGAYGLDDVVPPRYSPLLINTFNAISQLASLMQVAILLSSNFTMMCLRLKQISITTDIPADEVHSKQLRRIAKSVEARHDMSFTLASLDVDVSVATPISDRARADYTKTWDSLVGEVTFSLWF